MRLKKLVCLGWLLGFLWKNVQKYREERIFDFFVQFVGFLVFLWLFGFYANKTIELPNEAVKRKTSFTVRLHWFNILVVADFWFFDLDNLCGFRYVGILAQICNGKNYSFSFCMIFFMILGLYEKLGDTRSYI